jgi:hypothetical protein
LTDLKSEILYNLDNFVELITMETNFEEMMSKKIEEYDSTLKDYNKILTLYDEVEYFQKHDSPLFSYPFTPRKFQIERLDYAIGGRDGNYDYSEIDIDLNRAEVCLESDILSQLLYFEDVYKLLRELAQKYVLIYVFPKKEPVEKEEPHLLEDSVKEECESGRFFRKIKFHSYKHRKTIFSNVNGKKWNDTTIDTDP